MAPDGCSRGEGLLHRSRRLTGFPKENLSVTVEGDVLTISGEKREEFKEEKGAFRHLERTFGSFTRSFTLPDKIDREHVDAKHKDGVFELRLKKTGEAPRKGKQIEIKGSNHNDRDVFKAFRCRYPFTLRDCTSGCVVHVR